MQTKIRILGIAPYEGMQLLMQKAVLSYPQIDLNVIVGDLEHGVDAAQDNFHGAYDVLISRGGTARLLREKVDLPVVEIPITEYDILKALHLVENVSNQFAIVGFSNVTENLYYLSEMLSFSPELFTIGSADEVEDILVQVRDKGYRTVLCDVVANTVAKRMGMNAILITSGHESICKAFNDALLLCHAMRSLQAENHFLRSVIQSQSNETVVYDENKNLYFSTVDVNNRSAVLNMLKNEIDHCTSSEPVHMVKSLDGMLYSIKAEQFSSNNKIYTTFYFSRSKAPFSSSKSGIRYYTCQEAAQVFYNSFYSSAGDTCELDDDIRKISQSDRPVMLIGEEGTGKESVANMIYSRSTLRSHPFVSINCTLLNEKSWEYLQSNHNSPFAGSQSTIYLSQLEALSEEKLHQLLAVIIDMDVCLRNRVIFSCTASSQFALHPNGSLFANKLCCLTMSLPPLREQRSRIPALANLFLSQLNVVQSSDCIGVSDQAISKLQAFDWPHNLSQFKRVLQELATTTTKPVIDAADVDHVLALEASSPISHSLNSGPERFDLNRTLAEMEKEIVLKVIADCSGNQSAAAKQLGISRTTLWRYCRN